MHKAILNLHQYQTIIILHHHHRIVPHHYQVSQSNMFLFSFNTTKKEFLGSGSISSPDEETIQLIKYFKETINRLPPYYQKFTNEGLLVFHEQTNEIHSRNRFE